MRNLLSGRRRLLLTAAAAVAAVAVAVPALAAGTNPWDLLPDRTSAVRDAVQGGMARNVILLIGDGMGDSEITIARNYEKGANGRLAMDTLPLQGAYTTYAVQKGTDKPDYVTDSAASGTGWATGKKSYNGAISVDTNGKPQSSLLELARKQGYQTGNVTTAEIEDATPAVLGAHVVDRGCKGPDNMATCAVNDKVNGGAGSIAEQFVDSKADVILGGGKAFFDQTVKAGPYQGKTVLQQAAENGYNVITDKTALSAADNKKPLLGLFAKNNMDLEWTGPLAVKGGTASSRCAVNDAYPAAAPRLDEMANKAISLLNSKKGSAGFFLQVEGASIDKQDHASNPCGQIGETIAFDKAVQAALDFAKKDGNTSVFVTADHGHTSQIIEGPVSPGNTATLITNEGSPMHINYATSTGSSQSHTGTEVRIVGYGPQAANIVGTTNQTDLFYTISRALHLK
ncbi:alkaline phosphatase [Pseudonocardiaceae bacterium YIM PH 21723]|nr:alkaline phosphatase [Pseudonocardiaceae bacterium YIM PH 21723]